MNCLRLKTWVLIWMYVVAGSTAFAGSVDPLACVQHLQVSIGPDGYTVITPKMILTDDITDYSPYSIEIQGLPSDTVFCDQVGSSIMVTVRDNRNGNSCWSMIDIEDKLAPVIMCTSDTLLCNQDPFDVDYSIYASATDNCDTAVHIWYSRKLTRFDCTNLEFTSVMSLHFTAVDDSGNTDTCSASIYFARLNVADVAFPSDTTIACPYDSTATLGVPTLAGEPISDLCDIMVTSQDSIREICSGSIIIRRAWLVIDWCTRVMIPDTQVITVIDTVAPVLSCPDTVVVGTSAKNCTGDYIIQAITATDVCSEDSLITYDVHIPGGGVYMVGDTLTLDTGYHLIRYRAYDDCGNVDSCDVIINVVDDVSPFLVCIPSLDIYLDSMGQASICIEHFDHYNYYFDNCGIDSLLLGKMVDLCDSTQSGQFGFCLDFCCAEVGQEVMVIIKAIDFAGNMNVCMINTTVHDTIAPRIISGPSDTTISCTVDYTDTSMTGGNIVIEDNCLEELNLKIIDSTDLDGCLDGTVTRYFIACDPGGNADTHIQIITVFNSFVFDTSLVNWPPDICVENCPPDSLPETLGSFVTVTNDSCSVVEITYSDVDISDPNDVCQVILRTWMIFNPCGDTVMLDSVQEITIKNQGPPILSGPPVDTIINAEPDTCGAHVVLPRLVTTDCSAGVVITNNCTSGGALVDTFLPPGVKVIVFTATDGCGQSSTWQTTVRIVDNIGPVISCPRDTTVNCNTPTDTSVLGSASVSDNCSMDINFMLVFSDSIVPGSCPAEMTIFRKWKATDPSGNMDSCTQVIMVQDTTAVSVIWPPDLCVEDCPPDSLPSTLGSFPQVMFDTCNSLSVSYSDVDVSDPNDVCQVILRTWTISSTCGAMVMLDSVQEITIKNQGPPILSGPPADTTIFTEPDTCGAQVALPTLVTTDCSAGVVITNNCTGGGAMVDTFLPPGIKIITFTATDGCGQSSTYQTIVRVIDNVGPGLVCPSDTLVDCGTPTDTARLGMAIASDNCSMAGRVVVTFSDSIANGSCPAEMTIFRKWKATDPNGNMDSCTQTIIVQDTAAPIIVCPVDTTIECDQPRDTMTLGRATAVDNCDITVTDIAFRDSVEAGSCLHEMTIHRIWTATDQCLNQSSCIQTILIQDETPPTVTCPPDITVECSENSGPGTTGNPVVMDNCDLNPVVIFTDVTIFGPMGTLIRRIRRTWIATDACGNVDSCRQLIDVVDTQPPMITCPADTTVECNFDLNDIGDLGDANATDNCSGEILTMDTIYDLGICNIGTVTRRFYVMDSVGNIDSCDQIVTISLLDTLEEDEIIWPDSLTMIDACDSNTPMFTGEPSADSSSASCFRLGLSFKDTTVYDCMMGVCKRITREWCVIDSCSYDSLAGIGIFKFTQEIHVIDTTPPEIEGVQSDTFYLDFDSCSIYLDLVATADDCSGIKYIRNNSRFGVDTFHDASGRYPIGLHPIQFYAEDSCCNRDTIIIFIFVLDTFAPSIICRDFEVRLIGEPGSNPSVEVCISDLVVSAMDNCSPPTDIRISFDSIDPFDTCRIYNCDSLNGQPFLIRRLTLYIRDGSGNFSTCVSEVTVTDPFGACEGSIIGGAVSTIDGRGIEGVTLYLENHSSTAITNEDGIYAFDDLELNQSYNVFARKEDNPLNGISTRDILLIQRHLLGIREFDSPYKYLAADVNGSKKVEVRDIVILRKLLLGYYSELKGMPDWYFVNDQYDMDDPNDPIFDSEAFESYIDNLESFVELNYIGVKPGDVDMSASIDGFGRNTSRDDLLAELIYSSERTELETRVIQFDFRDKSIIDGYQLALKYDAGRLEIQKLTPASDNALNYSIDAQSGEIRIVYTNPNKDLRLSPGFKLYAKATKGWNAEFELDHWILRSELYVANETYEIVLNKGENTTPGHEDGPGLIVLQNKPNPFAASTNIDFFHRIADDIIIYIHDAAGRRIFSKTLKAEEGWNRLIVSADELPYGGIFYYQVKSSLGEQTKKLVLMN